MTYHALRTGTFPFPPPPKESSRAHNRPAPDLSRVPDAERPPLLRALSSAPQDRFPSSRDFMTAILKAHGLKVERYEGNEEWRVRVVKDDGKSGSGSHRDLTTTPKGHGSARRPSGG
jgi:hypothetical protein